MEINKRNDKEGQEVVKKKKKEKEKEKKTTTTKTKQRNKTKMIFSIRCIPFCNSGGAAGVYS